MILSNSNQKMKDKTDAILDYLFWILLILYTNPGGIFQALNLLHMEGSYNVYDVLFLLLTVCYLVVTKTDSIFDRDFKYLRIALMVFLIYYLIVFVYLTPIINDSQKISTLSGFIKSRWGVYSILLFVYSYEFFKRNGHIFINIFLISSIIILILFLQAAITKINVLPIQLENRGFININRILLKDYGLMPLLVPLGVAAITFKLKKPYRNLVLIGFALMSIAWVISLERRHLLEIPIYFILAGILFSYFAGSFDVFLRNTLKSAGVFVLLIVMILMLYPRYVEAARIAIAESINVILYSETSTGQKDVRLGLNRTFIVDKFIEYPFLGTGFDNDWRTRQGDDKGYEASDYPFLSSLAMFGIVGNLFFLPVYILLVRIILKGLNLLRNFQDTSLLFIFLLTFVLFFIFHFLQYFNYFSPVSNIGKNIWYISLAFYLASRFKLYSSIFRETNYDNDERS